MNPGRRDFLKVVGGSVGAAAVPLPVALASSVVPSLEGRLADIAGQAIRDNASPGVQLSVWREHARVASVSRGFGNIETASAVSSATIFRAGSLTKQFTAAMIAKLGEEGRLSVGNRLDEHLDFFPREGAPTLLELIHHTAGVHDGPVDGLEPGPVSQLDIARRISKQATLYDFPAGSAWLYSNANYVLLGAVIEAATGASLAEAARRLVFDPLALGNTRFDTSAEIVRNRASGYSLSAPGSTAGPFVNAEYIPIEQAGGAGAIRSSASDLCAWHQALFSGKLVSKRTLEAMVVPARLRDGRPVTEGRFDPHDNNMGNTSYGYGLLLDRSTKDGGLIAMHNGFINGFSAYLATHVPSTLTVACMCNSDPGPALPFRQLRRTVFARFL